MALLGDSVLPSVSRVRSPQTDHRFYFRVSPKNNEVALGIAVGKREAHDFAIELLCDLCVGNGDMGFVQVQRLGYFTVRRTTRFVTPRAAASPLAPPRHDLLSIYLTQRVSSLALTSSDLLAPEDCRRCGDRARARAG